MTDPFAALRVTDVPLDPDPDFAARLRARLERAVALPRGVAPMTATVTTTSTTLTPYLAVADARAAIGWYSRVLGARTVGDPIVMPDGRIGHAELDLGGAHLYLSDAHPEIGVVAPDPEAGASITLHLELADVDDATERARAEAGVIEREPSDNPYGRTATVRDPFGHRWMLNGPVASAPATVTGDVGYFALWVDDVDRATAFYARRPRLDVRRRHIASAPGQRHGLPHRNRLARRHARGRVARPHHADRVLRPPGREPRCSDRAHPRCRRHCPAGTTRHRRLLRRPGAAVLDLRRRSPLRRRTTRSPT